MIKKIFGYLLFFLAIVLGLALLFRLNLIMDNISTIFSYITSVERDDYNLGYALGSIAANLFTVGMIIGLFILGKKLIKKKEQ